MKKNNNFSKQNNSKAFFSIQAKFIIGIVISITVVLFSVCFILGLQMYKSSTKQFERFTMQQFFNINQSIDLFMQGESSKEILTSIRDINSVTLEVKSRSSEMLSGSEQTFSEMQKLDKLTDVMTNSMNEMASVSTQINKSVQDVNDIAKKNKHSIEVLVKAINTFKVDTTKRNCLLI